MWTYMYMYPVIPMEVHNQDKQIPLLTLHKKMINNSENLAVVSHTHTHTVIHLECSTKSLKSISFLISFVGVSFC